MRRYDDPVDVRKGGEAPEQFLWRGRLWKVREVVAHWVETGSWWQSGGVRTALGIDDPGPVPTAGAVPDLLAERELWRVTAGVGASGSPGIFDLAFDWSDGSWQLVGCVD